MYTLVRIALRLLLRHRLGPFFLAIILIVFGFILGATSRQVVYQRADHVIMSHYLSGSSDDKAYIALQDGSLYVLTQSNFTPALTSDSLLSRTATLLYDPGEINDVKVDATNSTTHLSGTGATVVQFITYGADGSSKTFTSEEYAANPRGFYRNNWGIGIGVMLAGVALSILLFFFARYRKPVLPKSEGRIVHPSQETTQGFGWNDAQPFYPQQQPYPPTPQQTPYPQQSPYPQQQPYPSTPQQTPYPQPQPYPQQSPYPQQQPYPSYPQSNPASGAGYDQPNRYTPQPGTPSSPWNPSDAQNWPGNR